MQQQDTRAPQRPHPTSPEPRRGGQPRRRAASWRADGATPTVDDLASFVERARYYADTARETSAPAGDRRTSPDGSPSRSRWAMMAAVLSEGADRSRLVSRLSLACAVFAVLAVAGAVALHAYNSSRGAEPFLDLSEPFIAAVFPAVGAAVLRRQPRNLVGWVLLSGTVVAAKVLLGEYAVTAYLVEPGLPLGAAAAWVAAWGWTPYLLMITLVPALFPDGRATTTLARVVARGSLGFTGFVTLFLMLAPVPLDASEDITNPLGIDALSDLRALMLAAVVAVFYVWAPLSVITLLRRQRRARGRERVQLLWALVAGVVLVVTQVASVPLPAVAADIVSALGFAAVALAIVVAITRYGMLGNEVILNRTLVYGVLSVLVLGLYLLAVVVVDRWVPGRPLGLGAVAVIALLVAMARDWVQRVMDKFLYGERRDPYAVVTRVGGRLDLASGPLDALGRVVTELAVAMKLPYVAVIPTHSSLPVSSAGERPATGVEAVPIVVQARQIGLLHVGHRHAGERFTAAEQSVLDEVAGRAGTLLYAADLVSDLQRSRERIVAAREEERRRLRHDLHDGLGPQLAGMALQLESLASRLGDDPEAAKRIAVMRDRMRHAVSEVRRVVDDLRPPALDELGLVGALRQHAAALAPVPAGVPGADEGALSVSVDVADDLPELPAAVEVAAYRIATESLTNVLKHAHATACAVHVAVEGGHLVVEVSDNGSGITAERAGGVGLQSMRDRAAELGGEFVVVTAERGTVVRARLPLEVQ